MSLESARSELGWPPPEAILNPSGAGASVIVGLARAKIGRRIATLEGGEGVHVGILTSDSSESMISSPLALVCEFSRPVPLSTLHTLHRLAWNFSRTPLLITCEPHRLRAFTCCELPECKTAQNELAAEISEAEYIFGEKDNLVHRASRILHWLNLVTGQLQKKRPERFDRSKTADNTLLSNLLVVRDRLKKAGLDYDVIHDLMARLIFIQFLFQRKDSKGNPALSSSRLYDLHRNGILSRPYHELGEILSHRLDAYALFRYLDRHFNGDLFPGKAETEAEREKEWRREMDVVGEDHLSILNDFVQGRLNMGSRQMSLWPLYSFDTIPLEFVSSIYETFVKKRNGTVYTPVHLVDFLLDGVLPWDGIEWDLKILDPACGSGVFLVRAFQRLVYRWRNAHPEKSSIPGSVLKRLLSRNLSGVDIDPHAVRVASFSLYLAMCDEIDPRHYWTKVKFPQLRGANLLEADFFDENTPGIKTDSDAASYDLIIGNPPWGKNQLKFIETNYNSQAPREWAEKHQWKVPYQDVGPLFVAKSTHLAKPEGLISLIQPTGLLTNRSTPALNLRRRLFENYSVIEVVNLSAMRFGLFKKAVGPASLITLQSTPPEQGQIIEYIVVKPGDRVNDEYRFVIEPFDIHEISSVEAAKDPWVWTAFTWGGERDFALMRRISENLSLNYYLLEGKIRKRWGIARGDRQKKQKEILDKRIFSGKKFPQNKLFRLDPSDVPINDDPYTDSKASTDFSAFSPPQLLVKQSPPSDSNRLRAVRVLPSSESVLCSSSYITINSKENCEDILDAAALALNSLFGVYFLFLSSGRLSNYRPAIYVEDLLSVPLPNLQPNLMKGLETFEDVDQRSREAYGFKEAEWALIEDMFDYTLPFFKGGVTATARMPTPREGSSDKNEGLVLYGRWLIRVLQAAFGPDKAIRATVFEESGRGQLPLRLIAIHLEWPGSPEIMINQFGTDDLSGQLLDLQGKLVSEDTGGAYRFQRVARIFDTPIIGEHRIPTIYIIKPDEVRYWTRSMAMRDADEIAMDILNWNGSGYDKGKD